MAETTATTKALTIAQPWATLVAIGAKQIETRSWQTNYRGDIAIHAGKGLVASGGRSGLIGLCNTMHFQQALYEGGFVTHNHCDFDAMPTAKMEFGSIIAIAELHDIRPTTEIADSISQQELAFGDYSPGRFAWMLRNVRVLDAPIQAKGALGLWFQSSPDLKTGCHITSISSKLRQLIEAINAGATIEDVKTELERMIE